MPIRRNSSRLSLRYAAAGAVFGLCAVTLTHGNAQELLPVPHPVLTELEPPVQQTLAPAVEYFRSRADTETRESLGRAYGRLGLHYMAWEQSEAGVACLRNAATLDPGNFRWPYFLALYFERSGVPSDAIEMYRESLRLQAVHPAGRAKLGLLLLETGAMSEAEAEFVNVLQINPNDAAALTGLGRVAAERGEHSRASAYFRRALDHQPEADRVHYLLATSLYELGKADEAEEHMDKQGDRKPAIADPLLAFFEGHRRTLAYYIDTGTRLMAAGNGQGAAQFFSLATAIYPMEEQGYLGLAGVHQAAGNLAGAEASMASLLNAQPEHADGHVMLAILLEKRGEHSGAVDHYRAALSVKPSLVEPRMLLANALMRKGDFLAAADEYSKVVDIQPANVESRYRQALAYLAIDQCLEAQEPLEQALAVNSSEARLKQALARAYAVCPTATRDQLAAALDYANANYQEYPGLQTSVTLAMVLAAMGEFDEAMDYQAQAIFESLKSGNEFAQKPLREVLELYKNRQPAVHAWPPGSGIFRPPLLSGAQSGSGAKPGDSQTDF